MKRGMFTIIFAMLLAFLVTIVLFLVGISGSVSWSESELGIIIIAACILIGGITGFVRADRSGVQPKWKSALLGSAGGVLGPGLLWLLLFLVSMNIHYNQ